MVNLSYQWPWVYWEFHTAGKHVTKYMLSRTCLGDFDMSGFHDTNYTVQYVGLIVQTISVGQIDSMLHSIHSITPIHYSN